ncbi:MAG: PhzF family phenazine biosynthesis protein [bacterium]
MKLPMYQVDAFANKPFEGNPAAVCPLAAWLPDRLMQAIAMENNLSETAFFVPEPSGLRIRWFTPTTEVDLCGHATLAAAHILFTERGIADNEVAFQSHSGLLRVRRDSQKLQLDFPAQPPEQCDCPAALREALGALPEVCLSSVDYLAVLDNESKILSMTPDLKRLAELDLRGVIVAAPSIEYDFVARFFAPGAGIDEDPVTGSAYTQLAPYWADRLGKSQLMARQLSERGGDVYCELDAERVLISGYATTVLRGELVIPDDFL